MIKAYLVGISTQIENEDIEVKYRIVKGEETILEKSILKEYKKPLVVTHAALLILLKELGKLNEDDEVVVVINDPALNEQIRGTSTTKNRDVIKMANKVRDELSKYKGTISVKDISGNHEELMEWNNQLKF